MLFCEMCNKEHSGKYGSGRFCSIECAKGYSGKKSKGTIKKWEKVKLRNDLIKRCEYCETEFTISYSKRNQKTCSKSCSTKNKWKDKEYRNKIIKSVKNRNFGGYEPNSIKRTKKGFYKGTWCDSSWELAYLIYCLDHNIKISKNSKKFEYIYENKKYWYIPDFLHENNKYIEVKGFINDRVLAKIKYFKEDIELIDNIKIKKYIEYVESKYGKEFYLLYET